MLEIAEIGPFAARLLADGAEGQVAAVFERSFYLRRDDDFACLGAISIGCGPLNARGHSLGPMPQTGQAFLVRGDVVTIAGRDFATRARARVWVPPLPPPLDARGLVARLTELGTAAAARAPDEGLARLVLAPAAARDDAVTRAARGPIAALRPQGVCDGAVVAGLHALLGLGPGLTPSGDDLIGGLLIAARALGGAAAAWATAIGDAVVPQLGLRTTPLSAAHLRAAHAGLGAEAVHALLADLIGGAAVPLAHRLDAIDRIGHCSGWDALAGCALCLLRHAEAG